MGRIFVRNLRSWGGSAAGTRDFGVREDFMRN